MTHSRPHLIQCLSWKEFWLTYALALTEVLDAGFEGSYPLKAHASPGMPPVTNDWTEHFRRAVRYLALEKGHIFDGLSVERDGVILGAMSTPQNDLFLVQFRQGSMPSPDRACQVAIQVIEEQGLEIATEPLRQMLEQVRQHRAEVVEQVDPDEEAELLKLRRAALSTLGIGSPTDVN
jgi:hypothetical protein